MAFKFTHVNKNCATCSNWGGPRVKSRAVAKCAEADQTAKGECFVQQKHLKFAAIQKCNKWEPWAALR